MSFTSPPAPLIYLHPTFASQIHLGNTIPLVRNSASTLLDKMASFNEREVKYMAAAFQSLKSPPDIDYAKMAVILSMTKGSVANVMGPLKKKIFALGATGALASTPRKRTPSKAKVVADNRNGNGDGETTPTPTSYKGAARKRKVDVDEGGEELEQSPKKRGGKKVKQEIKQEVVDKEYGTAYGSATS